MKIIARWRSWETRFKSKLSCPETTTTTTTTTSTTTTSTTTTSTSEYYSCDYIFDYGSSTDYCPPEICHTYFHQYDEDLTCEFTLSSVCDPNFRDRDGDGCGWYEDNCDMDNASFLIYGVFSSTEGMKTGLVCPACGCGENGPIEMHDRQTTRKMMKKSDIKALKNKPQE